MRMDARVTGCSWNTNGVMVCVWMLGSPDALGTRTESWFAYGCSCHRMLLEHERSSGLRMDARVTGCSWNTNGVMVCVWMLGSCSWNTNGVLVCVWMLGSPDALGTRTEFWFAYGCSGHRMLLEHERSSGLRMDARVTGCSWNTNGVLVCVWMLGSPDALGTRTESWFAYGCSGHRMLLEHERSYGLRMDARVTGCSWNTNGVMVCVWMLGSPDALGTRTESWFAYGCSGHRMLLEHERSSGLRMDARVTGCCWNTNGVMVCVWMLGSPDALGTRTESWFAYGCSCHRMLLEHERSSGLRMDARVTGCSWNTNGVLVCVWMLVSPDALGTRTEFWFAYGCSCHRMLLEHERSHGLRMDARVTRCCWNTNGVLVCVWMLVSPDALGTRTEFWFAYGCSCHRMLLEHERSHGLRMDARVTGCSWNTNGVLVCVWMLVSPDALGTRTESWFAYGCSGHRMLLEHERSSGLRMDARVTGCCWNTNGVMVCVWMLGSPDALGTRTELWFGMDARVTGCSWNTNGVLVCVWMLVSPDALGTRRELWFGYGFSCIKAQVQHLFTGIQNGCLEHSADDFRTLKSLEKP